MCGETQYKISISAAWVEALLYGLYIVLFSASIYVLVWYRPGRNKRNLIVSIGLFVFTTADVFLDYSITILSPTIMSQSFLQDGGYAPCPGADIAAQNKEGITYDLLNLISDGTYTIKFVLADGLLISRCITMWSSTRWIVIPLGFLLAATTAFNLATIYYGSVIYVAHQNVNPSRTAVEHDFALDDRFLEVGDIVSLVTNIITTSLIAFKIWRMTRDIERVMGRKAGVRYRAAMAILIESGVLFSATLVTSLASAYASVNFGIAESFVALIMGIAPTLIIVRVGLGKSFETVQESMLNNTADYTSSAGARGTEMSRIRFQTVPSSVVGEESERDDKARVDVGEVKRMEEVVETV